jgi:hypothetical protein
MELPTEGTASSHVYRSNEFEWKDDWKEVDEVLMHHH